MNLVSVKALNELHLNGVTVDWVKEDKTVKEVRLHDGNGGRIIIRSSQYGDALKIMVPQPYEDAERYLLAGRFLDLTDVREFFEYEHEAKGKLSDYESKARGESGLTVKKVSVKIDDAGKVIEASAPKAPEADDLPF